MSTWTTVPFAGKVRRLPVERSLKRQPSAMRQSVRFMALVAA